MTIERVLIDAILASKQEEEERKNKLSLFRENAEASTKGLHGHAVSSFPKTAVICLKDSHARFEGSWYAVFCIDTYSCSLKKGIKLSKVKISKLHFCVMYDFLNVKHQQESQKYSVPDRTGHRDNKAGF